MKNEKKAMIESRHRQYRKMSRDDRRKNILPYWIEMENGGKRWLTVKVDVTIDEEIRMSILRAIYHNRKMTVLGEERKNGLRWKKIKIEKR